MPRPRDPAAATPGRSAQGTRIAFAGGDRTVKLWDAQGSPEACILCGHTDAVLGMAFSPDGRRIALSGQDQTLRICDPITGQEFRSLPAIGRLKMT